MSICILYYSCATHFMLEEFVWIVIMKYKIIISQLSDLLQEGNKFSIRCI